MKDLTDIEKKLIWEFLAQKNYHDYDVALFFDLYYHWRQWIKLDKTSFFIAVWKPDILKQIWKDLGIEMIGYRLSSLDNGANVFQIFTEEDYNLYRLVDQNNTIAAINYNEVLGILEKEGLLQVS